MYLFAAETLGVELARCLVVEDSIAGLNAARAADMKAIAFGGASHIPSGYGASAGRCGHHADHETYDELPGLVEAGVRGDFGDVLS